VKLVLWRQRDDLNEPTRSTPTDLRPAVARERGQHERRDAERETDAEQARVREERHNQSDPNGPPQHDKKIARLRASEQQMSRRASKTTAHNTP
jgi:hypothetical protein